MPQELGNPYLTYRTELVGVSQPRGEKHGDSCCLEVSGCPSHFLLAVCLPLACCAIFIKDLNGAALFF